jgi:hypothetical protein
MSNNVLPVAETTELMYSEYACFMCLGKEIMLNDSMNGTCSVQNLCSFQVQIEIGIGRAAQVLTQELG